MDKVNKYIKNFVFILLWAIVFLCGTKQVFAKGFFYEVSKNGAKVYLLGSIHIAKEDAYPLDSIVEFTFKNCKNIVFEINISKINPFEIMSYGVFKDTMTLEKAIPSKYFKILDSTFQANGFPKFFYNMLQPWMATLLVLNLDLKKNSEEYTDGIEFYFLKKLDSTQNILELESFKEQLDVFKSLYELDSLYFLEYFLFHQRENTSQIDDLYNAWMKGDELKILDEITPSEGKDSLEITFYRKLNDERNLKMASKIEEFIASNQCHFVIVGSAHLFGKQGILEILKKRGCFVKRL
ncbi:MAG: hypothetical protein CH6_3055 [Candidatus Kapaibacterium sp.]|nr:MAG: hypothetical protein CH6_3055 [Candidatus Kapabacteria bacterium]